MADDRSIRVRFIAEYQSYVQGLRTAAASTAQFGREVSGGGKTVKADVESIGRAALVMGAAVGAGLALSVKAAIDWESAWAGVTKTVDGTESQMADLEDGLRDLAKELPATHAEIAGVAEAAGALGIQTSAIEGFTKTMIDLGETTNVTADQAATSFAKIANIMGTSQTDFDRMGSTLVELGNNGASTEADILELANRLAAAGKIAGLTEADIFAMASTLSSVGVEAEAGGSAMSKVMTTVSDAVIDSSEKLDVVARVAGVTAEQFATSFRDDPAVAINEFVLGLGRMIDSGESLTPVFKDLELTDIRLMNALKSTASAGDLLADSLETGRRAWEENNALQTEAEKRYDTTAAKMEIARNNIVDLGINIGGVLLPALAAAAEGASTMAQGFSAMPGPLQGVTLGIGGVALAGLAATAAAALLIPKIVQARNALLAMGAAGRVAAAAMPWLAAAAAAVGTVSYVFGQQAKNAEEAEERVKGFTEAIREAGNASEGTASHLETLVSDNAGLAELLDKTDTSIEDLTAGLTGSESGFQKFKEDLIGSADAAGVSRDGMANAIIGLDGMRDAALGGAEEARTLSHVLGDTGDEADNAAPKVGSLSTELGLSAEEAEKAREEFQDLIDAYKASVDPLFAMLDALEANREAMGAEAEARAESAKDIADATEAVADAERDLADARAGASEAAAKRIETAEENLSDARSADDPDADRIADAERDLADARSEGDGGAAEAAEERLADARERLEEVTADAIISAEELAGMNQDVAESALDVEVAARELAVAIADGTVDVEAAKSMLQEWVDQGLITEVQAKSMATQFEKAAEKASLLAGDYVVNFYANTADAVTAIDLMSDALKGLLDVLGITPEDPNVGTFGPILDAFGVGPPKKAAMGGIHRGLTVVGEEGPELVNLGSTSRVFPHSESQRMFTGMSGSNASSYDNSRHSTFTAPITIIGDASREQFAETTFRMKMMQLQYQSR